MHFQVWFLAIFIATIYEYQCVTALEELTDKPSGWSWENYEFDNNPPMYNDNNYKYNDDDKYDDGYKNNKYNDDDKYDDGYKKNKYDDDDNSYGDDNSVEYRSPRRNRSPDEYGNINLYFRGPSKDGRQKQAKKMRFPVHRFERRHAPPFAPLLSFLPWLPIFADRLTKQTIIFSPIGGVYIIPPLINFYGQRFSIAELIASGYCSLVSTGAPPPPAVDIAPLVHPGAVVGPGIPPPNPATGGFKGGVPTKFRSFPRPKYPPSVETKTVDDY